MIQCAHVTIETWPPSSTPMYVQASTRKLVSMKEEAIEAEGNRRWVD